MLNPYGKYNQNALMEQNQDLQQYGISNPNQPKFNTNSEDITSLFGKFLSGGDSDNIMGGFNTSGTSGKMGGSKMGYANAIMPWLGNSDKSTGQKVGSSLGTLAGFYFGGPIGGAVGGWAGDKIGSWLGG